MRDRQRWLIRSGAVFEAVRFEMEHAVSRVPRRCAALAAVALLAAVPTGCSARAGASSPPARDCIVVSDDVLAQISVGTVPGTPLALAAGAAVKARRGVYVVAARISAAKGAPAVGVWTVVALQGRAAPILVADEIASAHSSWSSVQEFPQYGVPLDSPSIDAARACLDR
jgi:hypothetical protein